MPSPEERNGGPRSPARSLVRLSSRRSGRSRSRSRSPRRHSRSRDTGSRRDDTADHRQRTDERRRHERDRHRRTRSRSRDRTRERESSRTRRRSRSRSRSRSRGHSRERRHRSSCRSRTRSRSASRRCDDRTARPVSSVASGVLSSGGHLFHAPPREGLPLPTNPLPIHAFKDTLRDLLRAHQILIVTGDTGSGKSTQLCQFMYEFGYSEHGIIAVTQPRRIGAVSLARRVSQELRPYLSSGLGEVGEAVGYSVRFEDVSSKHTQIKFLTDGCLLREALHSPNLDAYAVIVLDEAHERSLHTDVLFGVLKRIAASGTAARKHPLRIVVTSATLDTTKFCAFFDAPLCAVPGRCFPVREVFAESRGITSEDETVDTRRFVDTAVARCLDIHMSTSTSSGHILCFLTGAEEIARAVAALEKRVDALFESGEPVGDIVVLALHSTLPAAEQQKVFAAVAPDTRKVVFATNIAETSLTVDGVAYVVDAGLSKQKSWDPQTGMHALDLATISQSSAKQRMGRAGRTRPGVCYRLYTAVAYDRFDAETLPEIQRTSLSATLLLLKTLRPDDDLLQLDLVDRPDPNNVRASLRELAAIEAIDASGHLTRLGRRLVHFPLEPTQAKLLLTAAAHSCLDEMLTVVSMLGSSGDGLFTGRRGGEQESQRRVFESGFGDHVSSLFLFESWSAEGFDNAWLERHGVSVRAMKQAKETREQIKRILDSNHDAVMKLVEEEKRKASAEVDATSDAATSPLDTITALRKSIAITYFHQLARLNSTASSLVASSSGPSAGSSSRPSDVSYRPFPDDAPAVASGGGPTRGALDLGLFGSASATNTPKLYVHPASSLANARPPAKWIVYGEVVATGRQWMRQCCTVEYAWVQSHVARMKTVRVHALAGGVEPSPDDVSSASASDPASAATPTAVAVAETEEQIQAREARQLQQQILTASKAQVDTAGVADAKARYLERKRLAGKK